MKLLMITRKIDQQDASPAGFTYGWVKKIGEKLDKFYVITWQKSDKSNLTNNIKIISLPNNKFLKILFLQIYLLIILFRVDGVFCHQNPEYTILSILLVKVFRKKLISWYMHKAVNWKIKLVNLFVNKILTASEKSCRLKNRKKIIITGHGIDIDYFISKQKFINNKKFKIISVGRISPAKDYETLIKAIELLKENKNNIELEIIGAPVLKSDKKYFNNLKNLVKNLNIKFIGGISHNQILSYYQNCDLFVNLSQTGSLDKAVLEAMACEKLVLTSNEAFKNILDNRLIFESKNSKDLVQKIINIINLSKQEKNIITKKLRKIVVKDHNLDNLADKIIKEFL